MVPSKPMARLRNSSKPSHAQLHRLLLLLTLIAAFPTAPLALGIQPHQYASVSSSSALRSTTKANEITHSSKNKQPSLLSKLLYKYVDPLLDTSSHRQLQLSDALFVPSDKLMNPSVSRLESIYNSHTHTRSGKSKPAATLAKSLLAAQKSTLLKTAILRLANTLIQVFPSLLIARLLRQIEAGCSLSAGKPIRSALTLVGVLSVKMIVENWYFYHVVLCSGEVRGSVGGMIFDKSLKRLSGSSSSTAGGTSGANSGNKGGGTETLSMGQVVNLMQSDATTLEMLTLQLHTIWDGPLQIAIYVILLYRYLGSSVLYGLAVLLTTLPLNAITLRVLNRLSRKEIEAKDMRMRKTTESIGNMSLLKLMGWENLFAQDVQEYRQQELRRHTKRGVVRAFSQAISNTAPTLSLVVTLNAYAKTGKPIVASTIFTAISLFNQLRFPLFFYPMVIDSLANGQNSLKRISEYLEMDEITQYVEYRPKLLQGGSIEMTNGNFLWSAAGLGECNETHLNATVEEKSGCVRALCDASLSIQPGEIVAVIGGVGSGKSALVKGLIGELIPIPQNPKLIQEEYGVTADVPRVTTYGSIAYCSQEAWLPKGTIRESVVFGRGYDEERYLSAIYTAGLDEDIASDDNVSTDVRKTKGMLTHETDVGENGDNLSGGQRSRVALARALYEDTTGVYILDDPLSALDASVGSTVFERLCQRLRREKAATVFVTNDPNLPRRCDRVMLMGTDPVSGCSKIMDVGTYDELLERGHDLRTITHLDMKDGEDENADVAANDEAEISVIYESNQPSPSSIDNATFVSAEENLVTNGDAIDNKMMSEIHESTPLSTDNSTFSLSDCNVDPDCITSVEEDPTFYPLSIETNQQSLPSPDSPQRQLSTDDSMSTGSVPRSTYITYLKSVKNPLLLLIALGSYFASNGSQFFQQLVIAKWTEASAGGAISAAISSKYCRQLIYAAIGVSISMYMRSFLTMKAGVRASKTIHQAMLKSVFGAPISFFSATPSGQLLTRFGRELEVVDRSLPDGIASLLFCFLQVFFSTIALAGVVTPLMTLPLGLVGVFYVKTMARFRPAARDLKRLESKSRSPIYTHFREALRGSETIRSIPAGEGLWSRKHRQLADENLSIFYSVKSLDRWLSIRLETLGNVVVLAAAFASILLTRAGKLKSGSAGWGLTQALSITSLLAWCVRVLTDLEAQFLSVMRTLEVTDLESTTVKGVDGIKPRMPREYYEAGEALVALQPSGTKPPQPLPRTDADLLNSGWPWRGHIQLNNVSIRYNSYSPRVLKNVSANIPAGTTLGVVGRTGSGKSSLLLTLFRLVEIDGDGGSITIDGVDIRALSLKGLRDSISIIPQSPTLFAGTLMYNLDASGQSTPEVAWSALESASPELAKYFRDSESGLDTIISEGGDNLSAGQRQLVCLARALIKRSKILVLDEATSSIDMKTDAQVQETIRREFVRKGVTVITVAHRLDTVLQYDQIIVLDSGKLVEMGRPGELLKNPGGYLRNLFDADKRNRVKGRQVIMSSPN